MSFPILAAGLVIIVVTAARPFFAFLWRTLHPFFSPLRDVVSPPRPSFIWGHTRYIDQNVLTIHDRNVKKYGRIVNYKGHFNVS